MTNNSQIMYIKTSIQLWIDQVVISLSLYNSDCNLMMHKEHTLSEIKAFNT